MTDLLMDLSGDHCLLASCMVSGVTVARARFLTHDAEGIV